MSRLSSTDPGYVSGELSVYPQAIDTVETLYEARNNSQTMLTQTLGYAGTYMVVQDTSSFPPQGLLRVGGEVIFYGLKTTTSFKQLQRPFVATQRQAWPAGTAVVGGVMAEQHNALKDAIIQLQTYQGTADALATDTTNLNGILKSLEEKFLAPKPLFRAVPRTGSSPLEVKFQNFSDGQAIRFLWDFGDGGTSSDSSPSHIYAADGSYTVTLSMITSLGGTGVLAKSAYIVVGEDYGLPFFYVTPLAGSTTTTFSFVDQTISPIAERHWIWDDGTNLAVIDSAIHVATHQYSVPGPYNPTLLLVLTDGTARTVHLNDMIEVTE